LQGILGIEEHYFTEKLAITKTNAKNRKWIFNSTFPQKNECLTKEIFSNPRVTPKNIYVYTNWAFTKIYIKPLKVNLDRSIARWRLSCDHHQGLHALCDSPPSAGENHSSNEDSKWHANSPENGKLVLAYKS
jgi:hypothetical protein